MGDLGQLELPRAERRPSAMIQDVQWGVAREQGV